LFSPFREIYLAVGSLSPKTSSKIVQSREHEFYKKISQKSIDLEILNRF
jgi:hypothetical protein